MKIAIFNPSDIAEVGFKGGNQRVAESLAENIRKFTNHKVDLIFTERNPNNPISLLKSYIYHMTRDLSDYDLVISLKFPSFTIRHKNHICYFAHFHRYFYDWWPEYKKSLSLMSKPAIYLLRFFVKTIDRLSLRRAKKVFAHSKFASSFLNDLGINNEVLYAPPAKDKYYSGGYRYILSPSILNDSRKRISLLIKSMENVDKKTKLVIVGDGPDYHYLKKLAGKNKKIIFTGYKNADKIRRYYSEALCVGLVSFKEDYGLVSIEAMKSKKPVLTCVDSGGPLEFVKKYETGLICKPEPEDIAKKINYLLYHPSEAKRMGENAYNLVNEIKWENVIKQLLGEQYL